MPGPFDGFWLAYNTKKKHPNKAHRLATLRQQLIDYELIAEDELDRRAGALAAIRRQVVAEVAETRVIGKTGAEKYAVAIAALKVDLTNEELVVATAMQELALRIERQRLALERQAEEERRRREEKRRRREERRRLQEEQARREEEERRRALALAEQQRKEAARNALARCKTGYEAVASPYQLVRTQARRLHKEPRPTHGGDFARNGDEAELAFVLDSELRDCETIQVKRNDQIHLEADEGEGGPPATRSDKVITGDDATAVIGLATRAIHIARALCPGGTFNNAKRYDTNAHAFVYQSPRDEIRWRISKSETMRDQLQQPFKPFGKQEFEGEESFLRSMAAMGKATFISGGGVCAQMSHLTLGLLSMLAPQGTLIAVVYDKVIDHSYTVVAGANTDWFVCDPWPGSPHVLPWRYCCFPRRNILNHFLIRVTRPVDVAYGIAFSLAHVNAAKRLADKERNTGRMPDHEWRHDANPMINVAERFIFGLYDAGEHDASVLRQRVNAQVGDEYKVYDRGQRRYRDWKLTEVNTLLTQGEKHACATWLGTKSPVATEEDWGAVVSDRWAE